VFTKSKGLNKNYRSEYSSKQDDEKLGQEELPRPVRISIAHNGKSNEKKNNSFCNVANCCEGNTGDVLSLGT
jgi:hypothetical protein